MNVRVLLFDSMSAFDAMHARVINIFDAAGFGREKWCKPIVNGDQIAMVLPRNNRMGVLKAVVVDKPKAERQALNALVSTIDTEDRDWFPPFDPTGGA